MGGAVVQFLRRLFGRAAGGPRTAAVGRWGERQAAAYLKAEGYAVVGRNVRPDRRDEIDIIARKGEALVFVEVKARQDETFGRPAAAVDRKKRHALNRAAAAYLRKAGYPRMVYRFDVVEVVGSPEGGAPEIRHLEDAFPFEARFTFPAG